MLYKRIIKCFLRRWEGEGGSERDINGEDKISHSFLTRLTSNVDR